MIYCVLDGDIVYPSLSSNIKITRENHELKDKGSYTLDVTFPMSIYENQLKFRHLNRIDVSLKKNDYDSATLYVHMVAVISGIGVITSVSNTEVKLQIMDSNSEFKYVSGFDNIYIDELLRDEYNQLTSLPSNPPIYFPGENMFVTPATCIDYGAATTSQIYVGKKNIGIYTPVFDETSSEVVNEIVKNIDDGKLVMIRPAYQPNLLYIMRKALEKVGYKADLSILDEFPWNVVYIVNTGCHLPHWTLERFITEFKNFFAVSMKIDGDKAIFCRITGNSDAVSYECVDDFTVEYDDEGIQSNSTSNLKYNLYACQEKTFYTEIPEDVMKTFKTVEYTSETEALIAFNGMEELEKTQTIFATPTGYFYAKHLSDGSYLMKRCGQFNPIVRNENNDNYEELAIVPVNMVKKTVPFRIVQFDKKTFYADVVTVEKEDIDIIIPVAAGEEMTYGQYGTVQQALEEGETTNEERSDTERMEVFFLGSSGKSFTALDTTVRLATIGTDNTIDEDFTDRVSFALCRKPSLVSHIGQLHSANAHIDGKNQRCIKFLCDDIPDPTRIFIFHNKRYVCEKIEIQITEKGIDQVKTGYFYEIFS